MTPPGELSVNANVHELNSAGLDNFYPVSHVVVPNLPPLLMVERQLFKIILIGNLLLTGTLITGFVFVQDMFAQGSPLVGRRRREVNS